MQHAGGSHSTHSTETWLIPHRTCGMKDAKDQLDRRIGSRMQSSSDTVPAVPALATFRTTHSEEVARESASGSERRSGRGGRSRRFTMGATCIGTEAC